MEHTTSDGRLTSNGGNNKSQLPLPSTGTDKNGLSMGIVKLYKMDPVLKRPKLVPTDMDVHEGWVQQMAIEKRNIVESIETSIKYGYTRDLERAKQILKLEIQN